eukprot:TRINITY_DN13879_c0_g1_i1.p1 TRINITY_DN13879_c0_g1~~TRINITY_DN13879_c0_g1_i1.p1  ORF type:complete len:119 (-),score=16.13 TRINITY_DN13879_c0_g1_i1:80-436(-)
MIELLPNTLLFVDNKFVVVVKQVGDRPQMRIVESYEPESQKYENKCFFVDSKDGITRKDLIPDKNDSTKLANISRDGKKWYLTSVEDHVLKQLKKDESVKMFDNMKIKASHASIKVFL